MSETIVEEESPDAHDASDGAGRGDVHIHEVAVLGTGFAGLGMSMKLIEEGIEDFVVFERASSVGGTWRDNTYPGCACDVPSHLYSFSFAPNPNWTRSFSRQPEIWEYLKRTAEESGVLEHVRFDCEVTRSDWDEDSKVWILQTPQGEFRSRVVVSGIGGLIEPKMPDVPGLADFEGEVFHSARWNHDYDLEGKRVAVVGTGASSIQFVPQIQPKVAELNLFQRTPAWIAPRADGPISERRRSMFRRFPALQRLNRSAIYWTREALGYAFIKDPRVMALPERAAKRHIARQVADPELRRKLTPTYTFGCKRALISNDFYPSVGKPNVDLLTEGLAEVRGNTVIGSDGTEREVDAIILGTGFDVTGMPGAEVVHGRDGRSLTEVWNGSPEAHRCTTVTGFPNLFILGGPNIGTGHMSAVEMCEHQYPYVLDGLRKMRRDGIASFDVRPEVQASFVAEIDRRMTKTVWATGGCKSWYMDDTGRNPVLWPDWTSAHAKVTAHFDVGEYRIERTRKSTPAAVSA